MTITLVLGGARSGKSALAQSIAERSDKDLYYIATATANDSEMKNRIRQHQAERSSRWHLKEETLHLAALLQQEDDSNKCLLIDCLTLWLTNLLLQDDKALINIEIDKLQTVLPTLQSDIIMVSNEVGSGIVPLGELSRRFCDETGALHQSLAKLSDTVILTIAGLPQYLKGSAQL